MPKDKTKFSNNCFIMWEQYEKPGDAEKAFKAAFPMFFNPDGTPLDPTKHPNYAPPLHKVKDHD